jgi:hypothetical protein
MKVDDGEAYSSSVFIKFYVEIEAHEANQYGSTTGFTPFISAFPGFVSGTGYGCHLYSGHSYFHFHRRATLGSWSKGPKLDPILGIKDDNRKHNHPPTTEIQSTSFAELRQLLHESDFPEYADTQADDENNFVTGVGNQRLQRRERGSLGLIPRQSIFVT